jgi:hypothetical protein
MTDQWPSQSGLLEDVRIHTCGAAADAAKAFHAEAFTIGRDIAFAPGRFAPETVEGRRLLGHELAHVDQQRGETPRLQCKGEEEVPRYLYGLHMRLREHVDKRVKFWADEFGPLGALQSKYGISPLREDAILDIPAIDWEHPFAGAVESIRRFDFTTVDPAAIASPEPPRQFQLHSTLAGGYELMDVIGDGRVLVARDGIGYVFDEHVFAFLFGQEFPELFKEMEAPSIYIHEHPGRMLALKFGMEFIPAATAFMLGFPEFEMLAGGAPLVGWESEGAAAFELEALPSIVSEDIASGANVLEALNTTAGGRGFSFRLTFASEEAWIYDGRMIRVVNTPAGPRAFYRHTGRGGDFFMGAQVGDWVPFDGFQPDPGGAIFVKPFDTFEPSTPLTLYRWGTEENQAIGMWIRAQPEAPAVDVGEAWGLIQKRLQELGVPLRYP